MKTFICLLRGVNVCGKNLLKMADLKNKMKENGYSAVSTYIQSGNIIFNSDERNKKVLEEKLKELIKKEFNVSTELFLLYPTELQMILDENTLLKETYLELKNHYFLFLNNFSKDFNLNEIIELPQVKDEKFLVGEKVLYIHYKNGAGKSKITTSFLEKKLNRKGTMRNLNTVKKLIELGEAN